MSHPPASRPSRSSARLHPSRRSAMGSDQHLPARPATHGRPKLRRRKPAVSSGQVSKNQPTRKGQPVASQPLISSHQKKVLWAGGAITLLAMATILPTQVSSQAIPDASCEQVIKSGAEISRGQISQLLTFPQGTRKTAIRQVIEDPYCMLPTATAKGGEPDSIEREAYPLAFDPEAWVVVSYESGEYSGYDFVFKP